MPTLRPPTLLGIFGAAVGLISILSALTPSLANRSDLVQAVLPPGVPSAARWLGRAADSPAAGEALRALALSLKNLAERPRTAATLNPNVLPRLSGRRSLLGSLHGRRLSPPAARSAACSASLVSLAARMFGFGRA